MCFSSQWWKRWKATKSEGLPRLNPVRVLTIWESKQTMKEAIDKLQKRENWIKLNNIKYKWTAAARGTESFPGKRHKTFIYNLIHKMTQNICLPSSINHLDLQLCYILVFTSKQTLYWIWKEQMFLFDLNIIVWKVAAWRPSGVTWRSNVCISGLYIQRWFNTENCTLTN